MQQQVARNSKEQVAEKEDPGEQTELLVKRCAELELLSTGSSDYHGPQHHTFSRFRAFSTYGLEPALGPLAG